MVLQSGMPAQRLATAQAGVQEAANFAEWRCIQHQQLQQQRCDKPHSTAG
jgi:hypothetical protein